MGESGESVYLSIASTLAWTLGIFTLLAFVGLVIPAVSMGTSLILPVLALVFGGLYCSLDMD